MRVPSMKDVIDGIIQHNIYKININASEYSFITQEEKNEGFLTLKNIWMDIFKAAKIENADQPIKSQDITNPYSKTC